MLVTSGIYLLIFHFFASECHPLQSRWTSAEPTSQAEATVGESPLIPSNRTQVILAEVANLYGQAKHPLRRRLLLSSVASWNSKAQLEGYIPGLSNNAFESAREMARMIQGIKLVTNHTDKEYFNQTNVARLLYWLCSETILPLLPPDNSPPSWLDPEVASLFNKKLGEDFAKYLVELYQKWAWEWGHPPLRNGTVYQIIELVLAMDRGFTASTDPYLMFAFTAVQKATGVLTAWKKLGLLRAEVIDGLIDGLREGLLYLETDYRLNVKKESNVADMCSRYALSDPNITNFFCDCGSEESELSFVAHQHSLTDPRMEYLKSTLKTIRIIISQFSTIVEEYGNREMLKDQLQLLRQAPIAMLEYRAQQVRVYFSEQRLESLLRKLTLRPMRRALIYLDVPTPLATSTEGQKRIIWHVAVARVESRDGQVLWHRTIHLTKRKIETVGQLFLLIRHVLAELGKQGVTEFHFRSTNPGNFIFVGEPKVFSEVYRRSVLMAALQGYINYASVKSFSFTDSLREQGVIDRVILEVRQLFAEYIDGNHAIDSAEDAFAALTHRKTIGMSVYLAELYQDQECVANIPGIAEYNEFTFGHLHGCVKMWKYYDIGSGELYEKPCTIRGRIALEKSGGMTGADVDILRDQQNFKVGTESRYWEYFFCPNIHHCTPERSVPSSNLRDIEVASNSILSEIKGPKFPCPDTTCRADFTSHRNLLIHIWTGKHERRPEKLSREEHIKMSWGVQADESPRIWPDWIDYKSDFPDQNSTKKAQPKRGFAQKTSKRLPMRSAVEDYDLFYETILKYQHAIFLQDPSTAQPTSK